MTTQTATAEQTATKATVKPNKAKAPTPQAQPAKEIIRFKQDFNYHFMSVLLNSFHSCGCICDERFRELLKPLEDYVNDCIGVPDGLDIVDEYVVCECVKVDEEAYNKFVKEHITWFE